MHDADRVPAELDDVIAELRREPDVSQAWIESVAFRAARQRLDDEGAPNVVARRWSMRPSMAIAAGLFCAVAGSVLTLVVTARTASTPITSPLSVATTSVSAPPTVRFVLVAPSAGRVSLVGDFNAWNPGALPMRRLGNGTTWEIEVPLAPGRYTYAFVVDGQLARDPSAPQAARDDFGVPTSVVLVSGT